MMAFAFWLVGGVTGLCVGIYFAVSFFRTETLDLKQQLKRSRNARDDLTARLEKAQELLKAANARVSALELMSEAPPSGRRVADAPEVPAWGTPQPESRAALTRKALARDRLMDSRPSITCGVCGEIPSMCLCGRLTDTIRARYVSGNDVPDVIDTFKDIVTAAHENARMLAASNARPGDLARSVHVKVKVVRGDDIEWGKREALQLARTEARRSGCEVVPGSMHMESTHPALDGGQFAVFSFLMRRKTSPL